MKQLDKDPAKEKRILVEIPLMNGTKNDIWARWCSMYAGTDRGYFFVPEIGDEVLLGFIDDDPCCPVILGGLYSSKLPPPYEMEAENFRKGIVTKEGMKIVFDEEKKVITFETPGNNKIELSDDGKFIRLTDRNRNKMTMDDNGILLSSSGKITLKAEKDIVIDTVGNVNMTSNRDIVLEGGNVNAKARIGFTAKGNATAEISASGQTTIKGGIVMIN